MQNGQNSSLDYFYKTEAERFRVKVGVFLFLFLEEKILLLRRFQTGVEDGQYVVPMGGVQEGETPTQALVREAKEEANITISSDDLYFCHAMYRRHTQPDGYQFYQLDLFFECRAFKGEIKNMEPHKCDELAFFDFNNLPEKISPFIARALKAFKEKQNFSEFGFEQKRY